MFSLQKIEPSAFLKKIGSGEMLNSKLYAQGGFTPAAVAPPKR
jgi:hypothetical protein